MNRYKKRLVFSSLILLGAVLLLAPKASISQDTKPIHTISIDDYIINPAVEEYIIKAIKASEDEAQCLIIYLDTPGGLLNSTRNIVKSIINSSIPVIVYVSPKGARAGSAGVFITLSANIAAMAPSTNIGAAHPVQIKQDNNSFSKVIKELIRYLRKENAVKEQEPYGAPKDEEEGQQAILSKKIMNDTLAWVSTIAESRGRNVEWAKRTVSESISVTEKKALDIGLIDFIAEDTEDLIKKLDKRRIHVKGSHVTLKTSGALIKNIDMTFRQSFLNIVANPTIAYILVMLGFYGLLFEFTHPGIGFPGIAGVIAIILGFYSLHTLPTNFAGIALIILSIILFIAETQVASFGLLTLGGITCMFLGSIILIDSPYEFMQISIKVILPFVLSTAAITVFLVSAVAKAHRRKIISGKEGLIGEEAEALKEFKKRSKSGFAHGKVFVHGETWKAKSSDIIKKGERSEVIGVSGMELLVKKGG
ncbi:MAG: nodulation protein NfeD [Candidatus Omnitrophica bacterium]|nr:nodulation protein NfeD [Candidatus Omnitrophota bacterium]